MSEHSQKTVGTLKCTIVPFRLGNDADDLPKCPPYERIMMISRRVQDAREGELRHIASCADCVQSIYEFQTHLKITPLQRLEGALRRAFESQPISRRSGPGTYLQETYGTALYAHFAPAGDLMAQHRLGWRATHLFSRAVRQGAEQLDRRAMATMFDVCSEALVSNATAYTTVPHSVDAIWPLLECVQEAAHPITFERPLRGRYVDLWTRLLEESPLTVRTFLHWGLWELAFRGGDVGNVAISALRKALHATHSHEITPVAALVFQMHPRIAKRFDPGTVAEISTSPELVWMLERATGIKKKLSDLFAAGDQRSTARELSQLFDGIFDKVSMRSQLISTIVVRAGIVQALRALRRSAVCERDIATTIACGLFQDNTDRSRRSLYADLRIYDALRHRDATGWSSNLLELLARLPDYEQHGVVRTVVAAYEDATHDSYDARPPRFVRAGKRWIFTTPISRPFDHFCHGLAKLASASADYVDHVEWANARFDSTRIRKHRVLN